jgi:UDP-glucose:(heptosyl)LPS alpha-1,3-glucosyltransferase
VAGKGDVARYQRLASRLGVAGSVRFAGVQQGVEELYASADAHALLSGFDTFGMTVLEAMASGLPVILSPTVGASDLVQDGVQGFLVPHQDSDLVAARLLTLQDESRRLAMGQAARLVAEGHSWTGMAAEISRLYETIAAGKGWRPEQG